MSKEQTGRLAEWLWPTAFLLCACWVIWHIPAFLLDLIPPTSESLFAQIEGLHSRKDVTPNMSGLFGGFADPIDWAAIILMPIFAILGIRAVVVAPMEYDKWRRWDRFSLFIGRATMIMIVAMTSVMLYECAGLYAMQQRCHIRISLVYDALPRPLRKLCDVISTGLIVTFVVGLVFGSYQQVFIIKFYRWEMFGTAFDPPIPATIQPMILIVLMLIALQAVANLIADWDLDPETFGPDEIDQDEIDAIRRSVEAN